MKRLLKSWVFWAFVAVPIAVSLAFFTYRHKRVHACSTCCSEWETIQWRLGVEDRWDVPLWPSNVEAFVTRVHLDGWAGAHEHDRGWGVSGLERMYTGTEDLLEAYETNAAFRAFMLAKRERGEVTRDAFLAALDPFVAHPDGRFKKWWKEFERDRPAP